MADEPDQEKMFRVYLSKGESGWVEDLGRGKVKVWNIPYAGRYNLKDVVQVNLETRARHPSEPLAGEILERIYHARTGIYYATKKDWAKLYALAGEMGAAVEGAVGPSKGKPGLASIAAPSEKEILFIVKKLKQPQPDGWEPNTLEK